MPQLEDKETHAGDRLTVPLEQGLEVWIIQNDPHVYDRLEEAMQALSEIRAQSPARHPEEQGGCA